MPFCNTCGSQYEPDYDCDCDFEGTVHYESEPINKWLVIGGIGCTIFISAFALMGLYAMLV